MQAFAVTEHKHTFTQSPPRTVCMELYE
jgi:hypothetical protein